MRYSLLPFALCPLFAACSDHNRAGAVPRQSALAIVAFETRIEIISGVTSVSDATLADLTGDAVMDLAVVDRLGAVRVLVGQGNGQLERMIAVRIFQLL